MIEEGPLFKTVISAPNEVVGSMLLEVMEYLGKVVTAMPRLDTAELEFAAVLVIMPLSEMPASSVAFVLVGVSGMIMAIITIIYY